MPMCRRDPPFFLLFFSICCSASKNWRTCGAITFFPGCGGDDGNCACAWLFFIFLFSRPDHIDSMAVESSAFSHEQKNKFLLCSTGSRVCTHSLYVLCSPLSLFCWFSSPPEIGRVEEGSRKRKKRSHEKSQQIPNSPSPHRQLSSYIYINISRPYPRALFYFFFFDLSRADRC